MNEPQKANKLKEEFNHWIKARDYAIKNKWKISFYLNHIEECKQQAKTNLEGLGCKEQLYEDENFNEGIYCEADCEDCIANEEIQKAKAIYEGILK
jgi:hypothetical protein